MVKGARGKFKTKRGGGRNFSRHLELDENGTAVSVDRRPRHSDQEDDDEDGSDENEDSDEDEDEEEEEEEKGGEASGEPELSRAERRELKKKQATERAGKAAKEEKQNAGADDDGDEDEDELLVNPNHVTKKLNISDLSEPRQLTRREREQKEKQDAKERYWKLHVQGKTDQAKADLSRLAKIRADREAAAAKRKAEAEEKAKAAEALKAAQSSKR